jgi:sugar lactone lactonase
VSSVRILDERGCRLGEGPSYEGETDTLFWFDILDRKLLEYRIGTGQSLVHDLPFMASAIFAVDAQRQLVLSENGLYVRDRASGALTLHTPIEADNPVTRSNDARSHVTGAIWLGTMGIEEEAGAGAIYHFFKGKLTRLFANITIPNSICFAPDGAAAYFTDTVTQKMMRVAIDPATALPLGEPAVFFVNTGDGYIDGSVCDADGNVWNARWGAGALCRIAPDGHETLRIKIHNSPQTSCPSFVGKAFDRMIVTSANKLMSQEALAANPDAGKTFYVDHLVRGRAEPRVLL